MVCCCIRIYTKDLYIHLQIHWCSCAGGEAVTLGPSKKRVLPASCKTCGGKQPVDGGGPLSSSMHRTVGPELTRTVNSDLNWNKISKGNRSSLARARKSVEHSQKTSEKLTNQDYEKVDMPVSESEKLGMTVVGCRSNEKVEQVPIKKRWFLFRSPSPSPRTSPRADESEGLGNSQHDSCQGFHMSFTVGCQSAAPDATASADTGGGQTLDNETSVNEKHLAKTDEQGNNHDLCGISILATAACDNSLGEYVDGCPGVEGSVNSEGMRQVQIKIEPKKDPMNSADLLTERSSCVSTMPSQDITSSEVHDSPQKDPPPKDRVLENVIHVTSGESVVSESNILLNKDDSKILRVDPSARDGRLHWDLNTMMDAWENPSDCEQANTSIVVAEDVSKTPDDAKHSVIKTLDFDCKLADALTIVTDGIPKSEAERIVGTKTLDVCDFQREIGDAKNNTERTLTPLEFKQLSFEPQESKLEEDKLDTGAGISGAVCTEENSLSTGIHLAKVDLMDPERKTKSLHIQDKMIPLAESVFHFATKHAPESSAYDIVNEDASAVSSKTSANSDNISFHRVAEMDSSVDYSLISEHGHHMSSYNDAAVDAAMMNMESCTGNLHGSHTNVSYLVILSDICSMVKNTCDSEKVQDHVGGGASCLPGLNDKGDVDNVVNDEIVQPLVDDAKQSAAIEAQDVVSSLSTQANIETHPSGSSKRVQPVVPVDTTIQSGEDYLAQDATIPMPDTHMHIDQPLSGLECHDAFRDYHDDEQNHNNANVEEDGYDTDVSRGSTVNEVFETVSDLRMDYDSQYEDGELRESSLHAWEEDDGEDVETEHVDYGSDNRDNNNMGSENTECNSQLQLGGSFRSEVVDAGCNPEETAATTGKPCLRVLCPEQVDVLDNGPGSRSDQVIKDDKGVDSKANVETGTEPTDLKTKTSGWDRLPDSCKNSSDMVSRITYRSIRKDSIVDRKDRSEAEDKERKSFLRVNQREVFSRIEKPASCQLFMGKDGLGLRGDSPNDDESFLRSEREFGNVRPFGRGRYRLQRGQGGGLWNDTPGCDRGLKRIRSPTYRGLPSSRHCRPDDVASDRRGNARRYHGRNGSLTDRNETFDMQRGMRSGLEMSPDRCIAVGRGRSARYGPQIDGGGPRGRYHGSVNDDAVETLNYLHPLTRGRRSFSPERRGNTQAHQFGPKSHSRSGTGSPDAWQSPRARNIAGNLGFRNRSRSPNFRSEARVPRGRSPCSRSGFTGDQKSGFVPALMGRDSPPPTSRWISCKQRSSLLDRRSPGRIGAWGERLELLGSTRKLNPNEYGRSVCPGRFSEFNGIGRGRPRYEANDDGRREHGYRHGIGGVKRFQYNDVEDDDFVMGHNSCDKEATDFHGRSNPYNRGGVDSRIGDLARRSRDERGPFLQRQDRKYNNNKSLRMQESDEDVAAAAPRRRIW